MKKIITIIAIIFLFSYSESQNKKTKELLKSIENEWTLDDNNNITYTNIIEGINLSKDEIYTRALAYFTYNYGDGDSVVQVQDKEQGTIIGKGLYANTHIGSTIINYYFDTWHILRIDIKDNRVRILLSLTNYNYKITGGGPPSQSLVPLNTSYPINEDGHTKNQFGMAFYGSHIKAKETLLALEKAIIDGNTSIEKNDW